MKRGKIKIYSQRAQAILTRLANEAIQLAKTPITMQDRLTNVKLTCLRTVARDAATNMPMAGLTSCVAVTLLKVGACLEMGQRFAFEYFKAYREQDVSLIFLANRNNSEHDNHLFILLGPVSAKEHLITAQGSNEALVYSNGAPPEDLYAFLQAQSPLCVLVDPYLHCVAPAHTPPTVFSDYCRAENITDVIAVKYYKNTVGLIENIGVVNDNAHKVAILANNKKNLHLLNNIQQMAFSAVDPGGRWLYKAQVNCFCVKDSEKKLVFLMTLLKDNHFDGDVVLTKTLVSKEPMLVIKYAKEYDLAKMLVLSDAIGDKLVSAALLREANNTQLKLR